MSQRHFENTPRLLIRVEDTQVTIEYLLTNLLSLLFSSFFCPFVPYCFTSAVSSTRSKSPPLPPPHHHPGNIFDPQVVQIYMLNFIRDLLSYPSY